jgi:hypothetical protein
LLTAATPGTSGKWEIVSVQLVAENGFQFYNYKFYILQPNTGDYLLRWTTGCAATKDDVSVNLLIAIF